MGPVQNRTATKSVVSVEKITTTYNIKIDKFVGRRNAGIASLDKWISFNLYFEAPQNGSPRSNVILYVHGYVDNCGH